MTVPFSKSRIAMQQKIANLLGLFLYRIAKWSSHRLENRHEEKWKLLRHKFALDSKENRTLDIGRTESVVYKANNEIDLKNLVQQASPGNASQYKNTPIRLPIWAREITPFLSNQLSVHTRRAYENDLRQFFAFLEGRILPENISALRSEHIILYRKYLEEGRIGGTPFQKTTINRKLAVVKSFFTWLRANHVVSENPAELVKSFPQNQESSLKGLSDDEARKILELPRLNKRSGALHSAILHVLLYMGLRRAELIDLKVGDLTDERGVRVFKVRGKGHKVRILPLTKKVEAALDHYFYVCQRDKTRMEEPLFMPTNNPWTGVTLKHLNPNAISYIVIRYAKKSGVLKTISPHSCRATCISNALDRRATHRSVQHLAGWTTPLMIQRYDKRREDLQNSAAYLVDYSDVAVGTS